MSGNSGYYFGMNMGRPVDQTMPSLESCSRMLLAVENVLAARKCPPNLKGLIVDAIRSIVLPTSVEQQRLSLVDAVEWDDQLISLVSQCLAMKEVLMLIARIFVSEQYDSHSKVCAEVCTTEVKNFLEEFLGACVARDMWIIVNVLKATDKRVLTQEELKQRTIQEEVKSITQRPGAVASVFLGGGFMDWSAGTQMPVSGSMCGAHG